MLTLTDIGGICYDSVIACCGVHCHRCYTSALVSARFEGEEFHCCAICGVSIFSASPPNDLCRWEQSAHPYDAESDIKICFKEDYDTKAMYERVSWLLFEHYFQTLSPPARSEPVFKWQGRHGAMDSRRCWTETACFPDNVPKARRGG